MLRKYNIDLTNLQFAYRQIFYDALVASGSNPAALLARDIIVETKDVTVISRLVAKLPAYLRNPNEKLLKELEVLIRPDAGKQEGRMITFCIASLVSRVCEKHKCVKSGLLDKYIKIFSDQYDSKSGILTAVLVF